MEFRYPNEEEKVDNSPQAVAFRDEFHFWQNHPHKWWWNHNKNKVKKFAIVCCIIIIGGIVILFNR